LDKLASLIEAAHETEGNTDDELKSALQYAILAALEALDVDVVAGNTCKGKENIQDMTGNSSPQAPVD